MSNQPDSTLAIGQKAIAFSLVAAVACVLANDALASRSPAESGSGQRELSARVTAIVERVRLIDPELMNRQPPEQKIAQWRNK